MPVEGTAKFLILLLETNTLLVVFRFAIPRRFPEPTVALYIMSSIILFATVTETAPDISNPVTKPVVPVAAIALIVFELTVVLSPGPDSINVPPLPVKLVLVILLPLISKNAAGILQSIPLYWVLVEVLVKAQLVITLLLTLTVFVVPVLPLTAMPEYPEALPPP